MWPGTIEPGAIAQFLPSPCNGFRPGPSFRNRGRPTDQLCFRSEGQYLGELAHGQFERDRPFATSLPDPRAYVQRPGARAGVSVPC